MKSKRKIASYQKIEKYNNDLDKENGPFIRLRHLKICLENALSIKK
jgi:hypothetical protein